MLLSYGSEDVWALHQSQQTRQGCMSSTLPVFFFRNPFWSLRMHGLDKAFFPGPRHLCGWSPGLTRHAKAGAVTHSDSWLVYGVGHIQFVAYIFCGIVSAGGRGHALIGSSSRSWETRWVLFPPNFELVWVYLINHYLRELFSVYTKLGVRRGDYRLPSLSCLTGILTSNNALAIKVAIYCIFGQGYLD